MKAFKKLLSLFIVMTITIGCISVFAENAEVTSDTAPAGDVKRLNIAGIENELSLLRAIGIVGNDEEHSAEERVTRGQFAIYAARIFGEAIPKDGKQYYSDVFENMDCFNSVSALYEMGLISIDENRTFEPERYIEYNEACKILVGLLGFGELAENDGGYPFGYLKAARRCELTDGLTDGSATYENIVKMLYNALNTVEFEVVALQVSDGEYVEKRQQMDSTPLTVYHDIYRLEGVVTKTIIGSVYDDSYCGRDEAYIGSKMLKTDGTDYDELLGMKVTAFYKSVKGSDDTIVCCFPDKIEETVISSDDFIGYDNGTVKYYDKDGKEKKISINKNALIVKNFDIVSEGVAEAFNVQYGEIIIKEQPDDGGRQSVTIMECETYIVDYTDNPARVVYGKYNGKKELYLNEDAVRSMRIISSSDGAEEVFARILPGSVLSVFRNKAARDNSEKSDEEIVRSEEIVRVYVSAGKTEGQVDRITSNNKAVIGGMEYYVNPQTADKLKIYSGMRGIFYTDMYGRIAYYIPGADAWRVGYVYKAMVDSTPFTKELKLKIFDTDSNHNLFRTGEKVTFNGKKETDADKMMDMLLSSGDKAKDTEEITYKQLIRFKVSDDGILTHIDTAAKTESEIEEKGSLFASVPYSGKETKFMTQPKYFSPKPLMDRNTIVFVVPDESENDTSERRFRIKDSAFFTKESGNYISAYETNTDYPYAAFIVARSATSSVVTDEGTPTSLMIIDEISQVLNEDGNIVNKLSGYSASSVKTIYCEADVDISNLQKGDVIRPALDVDDYMVTYKMLFDYSEGGGIYDKNDKKSYIYNSASLGAAFNVKYVYVVDKYVNNDDGYKDNVANIPKDVLYLGYTSKDVADEEWMLTSNNIVVYDSQTDNMYMGDVNDIVSFKGTDKGTMMIIWTSWGANRMQIAYR